MDFLKIIEIFQEKRKLFIRLRFKIIESASKISKTIQFFLKKKGCVFMNKRLILD